MVDVSKLKKKTRLGEPPCQKSIKNNLLQPDNAYRDGRTIRRTQRTHQLATRVTIEFYDKVKIIAARDRLKITELLEKAVECYEHHFNKTK